MPALRFGDETLLLTRVGESVKNAVGSARLGRLAEPEELYLVIQVGRLFEVDHSEEEVLYRKGRYLVVRLPPERAADMTRRGRYTVEPLRVPDTVFELLPRSPAARAHAARVTPLLAELSRERVDLIVDHLVSYGSRNSTGTKFREAAE